MYSVMLHMHKTAGSAVILYLLGLEAALQPLYLLHSKQVAHFPTWLCSIILPLVFGVLISDCAPPYTPCLTNFEKHVKPALFTSASQSLSVFQMGRLDAAWSELFSGLTFPSSCSASFLFLCLSFLHPHHLRSRRALLAISSSLENLSHRLTIDTWYSFSAHFVHSLSFITIRRASSSSTFLCTKDLDRLCTFSDRLQSRF